MPYIIVKYKLSRSLCFST